MLEDPNNAPEESMWQWIVSPERAPDEPVEVEIGFEGGTPVAVNGREVGPVELIEQLNSVAAAHGVGRIDLVENRLVGIKSRGAYETPGGTLLVTAIESWRRCAWTAKQRTTRNFCRCVMRKSSTTAFGSRRYAKRSIHFSQRRSRG